MNKCLTGSNNPEKHRIKFYQLQGVAIGNRTNCSTTNKLKVRIKEAILFVMSVSIGILLGRRFVRVRPFTISNPPSSNTSPLIPNHQPKLTREDVIYLIEANGSPKDLNLSDFDLSEANLRGLDLQGIVFSTYDFENRIHRSANLAGVNFTDANLAKAYLVHTNLQNTTFWQTNLYEATMTYANAQGASFGETDLRKVSFYGCNLESARFWKVDLEGANFVLARVANAEMTEVHIGKALIQEREETYTDYFDRWYVSNLPTHRRMRHLSERYSQAAEIYMNLKNAFWSSGRYREASWAYLKERRMRRATYAPWRARTYHGDALAQDSGFLGWRWCWFYLKHTSRWFLDLLNDATSGYGERPLRTLWLALIVLLFFPVLYWWSGQLSLDNGATLQWLDYFIFSLGAFTTMDFGRFVTEGWLAEILASMEALLGISILALLMFALGNRISRS